MTIVLGKSWCGWLCPFGLFQDWVARLRQFFKIREAELINRHKQSISNLKYILLIYLISMPVMVSLGWLSRDFVLAFCNCPAKSIMPLFIGEPHYFMKLIPGQDQAAPMADINVTPFIDSMLVLLIIFMVTAPLMLGGVHINLPKSGGTPMTRTKSPMIVSLDAQHRILVDKDEIS